MQPASARWDNTSAIILLQHFCLVIKERAKPTLNVVGWSIRSQRHRNLLLLYLTCIHQSNRSITLHWILSEVPKSAGSPVPLIEDLLMSEGYTNAEDSRTWLWKHLILSPEKIMEAAFMSTGQRENSLLAAVRKLQFTASNFGQIIGAIRRKRLTESLKKQILSAYNL